MADENKDTGPETTETDTADSVPETTDTGGTVWDAPNQQVVRPDQSPPWQEGTGGEGLSIEETAELAAGQEEGPAEEEEKPKRGRPRKTQEKDE